VIWLDAKTSKQLNERSENGRCKWKHIRKRKAVGVVVIVEEKEEMTQSSS
jgi:hypothetical protein